MYTSYFKGNKYTSKQIVLYSQQKSSAFYSIRDNHHIKQEKKSHNDSDSLKQWLSNFGVCQKYLENLLK